MRDSCCFDLQSFAAFDLFLTSAPSVIFNTSHFYISCCHSHTSVSPRFHLSFFCIVPLLHPIPPPPPPTPSLLSTPPTPSSLSSLSFAHTLARTLSPSWGRSWDRCRKSRDKKHNQEKKALSQYLNNRQEKKRHMVTVDQQPASSICTAHVLCVCVYELCSSSEYSRTHNNNINAH